MLVRGIYGSHVELLSITLFCEDYWLQGWRDDSVHYDVIVVGGGPVGAAVGRDIAAAGAKVLMVEEHLQPGEPLQCAGLVSARTLDNAGVSQGVIKNRFKGALVYSPEGRVLELAGSKIYALAIDRPAFDQELAGQAAGAGAEIINAYRAVGFEYVPNGVKVHVKKSKRLNPGHNGQSVIADDRNVADESFDCNLVIGADGHNSLVARWLGVPPPSEKVPIYAAEVELPGCSGPLVHIFLGRDVAPGWFGWVIPLGPGQARVGIGRGLRYNGARDVKRNPKALFHGLMERYPHIFHQLRVIRGTSGLVPLGFRKKTFGPHALLAGDAACHVKPISGGGLFLGLLGARHCARTAVASLDKGDFSESFLAAYQRAWEDEIGMEISCGLRHRETFLNLTDKEMELLIGFLNKPYWRKMILKYGDLDYHSHLAKKLSFAPPWAQRFLGQGLNFLISKGISLAAMEAGKISK